MYLLTEGHNQSNQSSSLLLQRSVKNRLIFELVLRGFNQIDSKGIKIISLFNLLLSHCFLSQRGLCYTFNSGQPGYPLLKQSSAGRSEGLLLQLDALPEQYYGAFNVFEGTGFRMLVHDQNEWPDIENHGIDVSPGFSNTVRIQRHKVTKPETVSVFEFLSPHTITSFKGAQ